MVAFTLMCCGQCGVEYQMPTPLYEECYREGPQKTFYCPNGHPRVFGENAADKMRRERDRAIQEQARLHEIIAVERRAKERAQAETKRVKRRATAALCPCCNRHFANVERHMKTKHPEVVNLEAARKELGA